MHVTARMLACAFGVSCFATVEAQQLTQFDNTTRNELGEVELTIGIESQGRELIKLIVPQRFFDQNDWRRRGALALDWRNCKTREMLNGAGELTQCIRRAFLSVHGEGDQLAPARLTLQVLPDDKLIIDYAVETSNRARPLHVVADTTHAGAAWKAFAAGLDSRALAAAAAGLATATGGADEPGAAGFIFFGDAGSGNSSQRDVAQGIGNFCAAETCDFALELGDNFYDNGVGGTGDSQWQTKFEQPYRDLHFPFRPALGNHDHNGNIQAQIDYSARSEKWRMPGRYYDFEAGDVAFFAIDSDDFDSAQRQWLSSRLAASPRKWKIVYAHHPVFSYGAHGSTSHLVRDLLPTLKQQHVDFFLCGHDHDKQVIEKEGLVFVVTGTGGAAVRPVRRGDGTTFAVSSLGFSHLRLDGDEARLRILDKSGGVEFDKTYRKRPAAATGH